MGVLKQIAEYLYLRKPDPDRPKTKFVKYMHGINRLSILLFLLALIILIIKLMVRKWFEVNWQFPALHGQKRCPLVAVDFLAPHNPFLFVLSFPDCLNIRASVRKQNNVRHNPAP